MKKLDDRKFRPIELVHDFTFIPCHLPQDIVLPSPKERIDRLKRLGYGGVALNPSFSDYLSPESIAETADIIRYAHEQGLLVWIYDEKYYPSGSAGGLVPRINPAHEAKALAVVTGEIDERNSICINSPHGYSSVIAAYACGIDEDGNADFDTIEDVSSKRTFGGGIFLDCTNRKKCRVYAFFGKSAFEFCTTSHNTRTLRRYSDTLNKDAVDSFLNLTFEGYKDAFKLTESIFTDEPQNGGLCRDTYCEDFRERMLANQNAVFKVYDIPDSKVAFTPYIPWTEKLPEDFKRLHGYDIMASLPRLFFDESPRGDRIRADYWHTVSELFYDSYSENYAKFCESHGTLYSGHFLYEENLEKHPYTHGDMLRQLGAMHIPGCDMLYASPEKILSFSSAFKFASSAAQLYEKSDCMAEVSNIMKDVFPMTSASYKLAVALETALGVTRFLSYYTETCLPETEMQDCCKFMSRLGKALDDMDAVRNVYVYVPNCEIMGETYPAYDASVVRSYSQRVDEIHKFTVSISEKLLRKRIDFNFINNERLEYLVSGSTAAWFDQDKAVLILPPHVKLDDKLTSLFSRIICGDEVDSLNAEAQTRDLIVLHKANNKREAYLIVNTGDDFEGYFEASPAASIYDPHTDMSEQIKSSSVKLSIPSGECRIVFIG